MPSSRSTPERRCSSPTRTHPGSGPPTRTPMVFWVSIFRREPTSLDGLQKNSKRSLTQSTTGHVKSLVGKPPPKSLQSNYTRFNNPVFHRPIELTQYTSVAFTQRLIDEGVDPSVGSVGDALDNALAETSGAGVAAVGQLQPGPARQAGWALPAVAGPHPLTRPATAISARVG